MSRGMWRCRTAKAVGKEQCFFESALASTLELLDLGFYLKVEQQQALKSFNSKKDVFAVLPKLLWLVTALFYCVQMQFETKILEHYAEDRLLAGKYVTYEEVCEYRTMGTISVS